MEEVKDVKPEECPECKGRNGEHSNECLQHPDREPGSLYPGDYARVPDDGRCSCCSGHGCGTCGYSGGY